MVVVWGERVGHPLFDLGGVKLPGDPLDRQRPRAARGRLRCPTWDRAWPRPAAPGRSAARDSRRRPRAASWAPSTCCTATRCASVPARPPGTRRSPRRFVVAHSQFLNESIEDHADVVFPAESYAEKDGTVTHPDGRLQRLRPAIGRPDEVQAEWRLLVELGRRLGLELGDDERRQRGRLRASLPTRCRSTPASRSTRSAARACAGPSATRFEAGEPVSARLGRRPSPAIGEASWRSARSPSLWTTRRVRPLAGARLPRRRAGAADQPRRRRAARRHRRRAGRGLEQRPQRRGAGAGDRARRAPAPST